MENFKSEKDELLEKIENLIKKQTDFQVEINALKHRINNLKFPGTDSIYS